MACGIRRSREKTVDMNTNFFEDYERELLVVNVLIRRMRRVPMCLTIIGMVCLQDSFDDLGVEIDERIGGVFSLWRDR